MRTRPIGRRLALLGAVALILASGAARAEQAWVRDEVRLNLRTGPSLGHRILGAIKTGDAVTILERGEDWTRVRDASGVEGWIPVGFLESRPPAAARLPQLEQELESLRSRLTKLDTESQTLRQAKDSLDALTKQQEQEVSRLDVENRTLKAGARWPEWITGASILGAGMILGAVLQHGSTRRRQPRIRL